MRRHNQVPPPSNFAEQDVPSSAKVSVYAKTHLWLTSGKFLWMRTIGSRIVGEGVDSLIFYPLPFCGVWSNDLVAQVLITPQVLVGGRRHTGYLYRGKFPEANRARGLQRSGNQFHAILAGSVTTLPSIIGRTVSNLQDIR